MSTFREFLKESRVATFSNVFGKRKEEVSGGYVAEISFKSFVTEEVALEMIKEVGIDIEPKFMKNTNSEIYVYFEDAKKIKPAQIKELKMKSFVLSARRFKS